MIALWTAAESMGGTFNTTMGKALGLKDALQSAQDAANPGVYELLGSAVNDAKAGMDSLAMAGLQVVHMWDEFAARITVDMQSMQKSGEPRTCSAIWYLTCRNSGRFSATLVMPS